MKKQLSFLSLFGVLSVSAFGIEDGVVLVESLNSDDIRVLQANGQTSFISNGWDSTVSLAQTEYDVDYEPVDFDFLGTAVNRSEGNTSLQYSTRKAFGENFWLLGSLGAYDGFTSYTSIWLDQYFKERFGDLPEEVEGADNYIEANPWGINGSVGARWMYAPNTGFAEVTVSQLRDDISPGYEIDFDGLVRGEVTLATSAISISTENILTKRIRTFVELRASKTSLREWRYGLQLNGNVAVRDDLFLKVQLGAANENPGFEAYYGNVELEYEVSDKFSLYLDTRYYEDTGEIENSLLFTSAAPGAESSKFGIGARWMMEGGWSARLYYSRLNSEYEPTNSDTDFFQNLYSGRDWDIAQLAVGKSF